MSAVIASPCVYLAGFEQGDPEWFAARAGIPTASEFATVMAKGRSKGEPSVGRRKYMLQLIGERMTGNAGGSDYENEHMKRGKAQEDEAREMYAIITGEKPVRVAFAKREFYPGYWIGCSPDSIIDEDGGLEIKAALAHIQLERILQQRCPPEHVAQVQGSMLVTQRKWWDFASYCPGLPLFYIRCYPDPDYLATMEQELRAFDLDMRALMLRIEELTS